MKLIRKLIQDIFQGYAGAIAFYTVIPIPNWITPAFQNVSRFAPWVGIIIGLTLWASDVLLAHLNLPIFTRSAVLVITWVMITGGLHLDGAMDSADGLAVMDPNRRLKVMADSRTGAFGVMTAIAIVLLKTAALTDLATNRGLAMVLAAGWGRWGQQMAIACYPYLKPKGKGAFHKAALPSIWFCLPALLGLLCTHIIWGFQANNTWLLITAIFLVGGAIALAIGLWIACKLGGHTGDTYGAVVELTEVSFLITFTLFTSCIN